MQLKLWRTLWDKQRCPLTAHFKLRCIMNQYVWKLELPVEIQVSHIEFQITLWKKLCSKCQRPFVAIYN
jgi:hypothetical protein